MKNVYTVRQVNTYIKNMFTQDFMLNRIYVKGEVSNCKYHTSGHIYFSLKDESGTIACVMFAGHRSGLSFRLQEGQQVIVLGSVSVYERSGQYPDKCERDPACHSDRVCIVKTCISSILFPCPCKLSDGDGSTRGKPCEEADYKGDDLCGGTAHTGERLLSYKLTYDHTVDCIIKLLEKCSEQDWEKEQQKLFPDDSICNFIFSLTYIFHKIRFPSSV